MEKIRKTDEEWQEQLDPDRYAVMRCSATEPAWSGDLNFSTRWRSTSSPLSRNSLK
jgi:peptide methionine sulfoxide reductase MsrB